VTDQRHKLKKGSIMNNHNTLFYNLIQFICKTGLRLPDLRLIATFGWAVTGLLISETVHLSQWALFRSGVQKAASKERQFQRWLHNERIRPMLVYPALIKAALAQWGEETLYLALDTSQLWQRFVIVRAAVVYRGRAIPVGWVVVAGKSATVAVAVYQRMLAQVAEVLPIDSHVVLLADRGFMDVKLMRIARDLGWRFRIRVKLSTWVYRATKGRRKVSALMPKPGGVRFFSHIWLTQQRFGPLHLALAYMRTATGHEQWAIVSDEPVFLKTFDEYGLRFDIEENFLDDKSAGFQLESSQIRDSMALSRLCLIMATATLYLVSTGTAVVATGKRHLVDTHWQRGLSYFQIGWRWVKRALHFGQKLLDFVWLDSSPDPFPAIASKKQAHLPVLAISCIEQL
jgi:hypothetical protein